MRLIQIIGRIALLLFVAGGMRSATAQVASFSPSSPKLGEAVTITYNPDAPGATILRPAEVTLQTLVLRELGSAPILLETPMTRTGRNWKATVTLNESDARFLLYQFVSGNLRDDNSEQGWGSIVPGSDGKALRGGHYWKGVLLGFGGSSGIRYRKDLNAAKAEIARERKLFPDNFAAVNLAWYLDMTPVETDAAKALIKRELNDAMRKFRQSEDALPVLIGWYEQLNEKTKADSLQRILVAENPKGKVAASMRFKEISKEHDPLKKVTLIERYVADFPMKEDELLENKRQLLMSCLEAHQYDKAYEVLRSSSALELDLYKTVLTPMLEKGLNPGKVIERATAGITFIRSQDESSKPPSSTIADWKRTQMAALASLLDIRGQALSKSDKKKEAESDLAEAYRLSKGNDILINSHLIETFVANEHYQQAVDEGLDCISRGKSNLLIVDKFKTAYKEAYGSLVGYDKTVQKSKVDLEEGLLKSGIDKAAPGFVLKDLTGATVSLTGFQGKVVVLSFWAASGGLSKAVLPQLQKVFESYQYYKNVAFLTINTAEHAAGASRESLVKKLMTDNKCAIPVAFDEGSAVSAKYEIEGIPTTYVIDREGKIRFKTVGFSNGGDFVSELTEQISILLKH
jgi:peroxiredoxin